MMIIRAYEDRDLAAVADLFTTAIHVLALGHYDSPQRRAWAPQPPDLTEWRQRLGGGLQVLVAEQQGRMAGFIGFEADGHVDLLFTSPQFPRTGVATALYLQAEAQLRATGVSVMFTEASLVARPFFERQGFAIEQEQQVFRRGVCLRRYAMRKTLGC